MKERGAYIIHNIHLSANNQMIHVLMKIAYYGFVQIRHIERKSQHQSIDRLQFQKMLRL